MLGRSLNTFFWALTISWSQLLARVCQLDSHNVTCVGISGMWLSLAPKMDTKKTCLSKEIGLHAQDMITISGSKVNITGGEPI